MIDLILRYWDFVVDTAKIVLTLIALAGIYWFLTAYEATH
jgi:hypothetical protein